MQLQLVGHHEHFQRAIGPLGQTGTDEVELLTNLLQDGGGESDGRRVNAWSLACEHSEVWRFCDPGGLGAQAGRKGESGEARRSRNAEDSSSGAKQLETPRLARCVPCAYLHACPEKLWRKRQSAAISLGHAGVDGDAFAIGLSGCHDAAVRAEFQSIPPA